MSRSSGAIILGLLASQPVGCVEEATEREVGDLGRINQPDNEGAEVPEVNTGSPCWDYYKGVAWCASKGALWGAGAASGGERRLPLIGKVSGVKAGLGGAAVGFLDCVQDWLVADEDALLDMARECGKAMAGGPLDPGPITGHESVECDADPLSECARVIGERTAGGYFAPGRWGGTTHVPERPCSAAWVNECEQGLLACIGKTAEICTEEEEGQGDELDAARESALSLRIDVDGNGHVDGGDVQMFVFLQAEAEPGLTDLNGDGESTDEDRDMLVHDLMGVPYGDANLDGEFDSSDLVLATTAGKYETGAWATWDEGDFNGDGVYDSSDAVVAFEDGCFEEGPDCVVSEFEDL